MKKEYLIILLVVGVGVYFFMKKTPQKKQLSNNQDPDVISVGDCPNGIVDECGVCDGDGAVYECGCTDIVDGDCDCDGNVIDACGDCGGGVTDQLLCESGVINEGEGTLTWANRDYATRVVQYPNGNRVEWMTENAKYVDELFYKAQPISGTNSAWTIYGFPENMQEAIAEAGGNWEKYGGLYNYNLANSIKPSGWRMPTQQDFEGLLNIQDVWENDFVINDLCTVEDWNKGLEGSNDSQMSFKGGGKAYSFSEGLGEEAYYVLENSNPRKRVKFNPSSLEFEVIESTHLSSLRFVRDVVDEQA